VLFVVHREDQADEYTSLKKELEQTNKNCRILSFKLRKAERKTEQLEAEKLEVERKFKEVAGGQTGLEKVERIKKIEQELAVANEVSETQSIDFKTFLSRISQPNKLLKYTTM
jgi:hypothetical protein